MSDQWYFAQTGQQFGPVAWSELRRMATGGELSPDDLVWHQGMANWAPAGWVEGLLIRPEPPPPRPRFACNRTARRGEAPLPPPAWSAEPQDVPRVACGVLAILLGSLGIHKFVLGRTGAGLAVLLPTVLSLGILTMFTAPLGIVEGIIYLARSDSDFQRIYVDGRRSWF